MTPVCRVACSLQGMYAGFKPPKLPAVPGLESEA